MGKKTTKINPWDNSSKGAAVAWSPPQKEKKKEKNAIQKAVERKKTLENLINEM